MRSRWVPQDPQGKALSRSYLEGSMIASRALQWGRVIWAMERRFWYRWTTGTARVTWEAYIRRRPLNSLSLFVMGTVVGNLLVLWLFKREIEDWGIGMRLWLFLLGCSAIAHRGSWEEIKGGSFFIRVWIRRNSSLGRRTGLTRRA